MPPELRFDLMPRQPRRALRLSAAAVVALGGIGVSIAWNVRDAEIVQLNERTQTLLRQLPPLPQPRQQVDQKSRRTADEPARSTRRADMRLLELERCVTSPDYVARLAFNVVTATAADVVLAEPSRVFTTLDCLNGDSDGGGWRATSISLNAPTSGTSGTSASLTYAYPP